MLVPLLVVTNTTLFPSGTEEIVAFIFTRWNCCTDSRRSLASSTPPAILIWQLKPLILTLKHIPNPLIRHRAGRRLQTRNSISRSNPNHKAFYYVWDLLQQCLKFLFEIIPPSRLAFFLQCLPFLLRQSKILIFTVIWRIKEVTNTFTWFVELENIWIPKWQQKKRN